MKLPTQMYFPNIVGTYILLPRYTKFNLLEPTGHVMNQQV